MLYYIYVNNASLFGKELIAKKANKYSCKASIPHSQILCSISAIP